MAVFAALWGEWDAANRSGLVQPVCSAAAPAKDMDTVGADLWGNARRHNAVVVDTDAVAHMEAAGLVRMDHDFLLCRMVADQELVAFDVAYGCLHGGRHGCGCVHKKDTSYSGTPVGVPCQFMVNRRE